MTVPQYSEDSIKTLEWNEHIRKRPGMYIGKLGDGTSYDDGIYVLIKEVIDNSIDEFMMGYGKTIEVDINENSVRVRDYGRGIPIGKLVEVSSKMNTGAKYDSSVFQKSVGLNGVGIKAVNALSTQFELTSFREGEKRHITYSAGELTSDSDIQASKDKNGTEVLFVADDSLFKNYSYNYEHVEALLRNYAYLNTGLTLIFNGTKIQSKNGLADLLEENISEEKIYPIIHFKGKDIELALTHVRQYGEYYHTFVNGQNTVQGGTHLLALREGLVKTVREFYNKDYDASDIRQGIAVALAIRVQEPMFESQTKTKLGSKDIGPDGPSVRNFVIDFVKENLDNYLHKNPEVAEELQQKILGAERERKAMQSIRKIARERAKKTSLNNRKLRDCRIHYGDKDPLNEKTSIFITEGDSASGSITKSRDVNTQAVFSLRGKPLNTYGLTKKIVYENEEFNLLQSALNIEESIDDLRYNKVIIATDADVDGMHIRLLLITFFLQFFPDLIRNGHLYILQTPLFRVRNKQKTIYCYNDEERQRAIAELKGKPEITRFKGLGEISPDEFRSFIDDNIKLEPVTIKKGDKISELLSFYMGKNTPDRQDFIVENLRIEEDLPEAI
ncbi:MAG: DNA topoisomerase IV subunit B [Salinivirgaceae bacterium]|jgi:topoisomerase-4 subunit B|nr:type IIA DNA topoisomerase subunit B [Bacteroidales bacterium]